ncbi:MAG: hypothetical protein RLZZ387_4141 [Chloroflexota bacterium]
MKQKRRHKKPRFRITFHPEPVSSPVDLAAIADALVMLHGDATLDAALKLAHNINTAEHEFETERQLLEARADDLRLHLEEIEARLRAGRTS